MTELSPEAQSVLDSYWGDEGYFEAEELPSRLAAALRAAADQIAPDEPHPGESQFWDDEADREWQNNQHFCKKLLAIADELSNS
jgi:hypothetical protein